MAFLSHISELPPPFWTAVFIKNSFTILARPSRLCTYLTHRIAFIVSSTSSSFPLPSFLPYSPSLFKDVRRRKSSMTNVFCLWELCLLFLAGSCRCLAADTFLSEEPPPAPEFLPIFLPQPMPSPPPPPPPPPRVSPTDYLISLKCSRFLNVGDKPRIMRMGEPLTLVFTSLIMACEDILCTKMYNASCSPQQCPKCKLYSGSGDRFQAQVEDTNGTNVGILCDVKRMFSVYGVTCIGGNSLANLMVSYVVRVYARQLNGTMLTVENIATVVLQAGIASIVNSGPGYWPTGNELMVGAVSSFMFPVKDKYNNIKKVSTGVATIADLNQFEVKYSSFVKEFRLMYDQESGYANVSFIPTKVGNWTLSIGRTGTGFILGSPYIFNVATSGPIFSENCLASWSSGSNMTIAGDLAYITIYLKDSYNNTVDISTGWSDIKHFNLTLTSKTGQICRDCTLLTAVPGAGYETAIVNATMAGNYKLNISDGHKIISGSPVSFTVVAGTISVKNCMVFWLNNTNRFIAGDQAILRVFVMDSYKNNISYVTGRKILYQFNVFSSNSLNEVYIYKVNLSFDIIPGYERITFIPTRVGDFVVHVTYNDGELQGSPLNFTVAPGSLSIPHCQGFWRNNMSIFSAGEKAILLVAMMDAYDNNIISVSTSVNFSTVILDTTGRQVFFNVQQTYDKNSGYLLINFNTSISRDLLLQVGKGNVSIYGSPFFFHVDPGDIFPSYCEGFWVNNISTFSVGSVAAFSAIYMDSYNNTINASDIPWVNISATIENGGGAVNFSVLNISTEEGSMFVNIYFISYTSGTMLLHVTVNKSAIAGSPFSFKILPGPIHASNCRGSWSSRTSEFQAGTYPRFIVYLVDAFNNTITPKFMQTNYLDFKAYAMNGRGEIVNLFNLTSTQDSHNGFEALQFLTSSAGNFSFYVKYNATNIGGSPFSYSVVPGPISVAHCIGFLVNASGSYMVPKNITVYILLKDAYKNNVTASMETNTYLNFSIKLNTTKGESYFPTDVTLRILNNSGYEIITFSGRKAGDYFLYVINGGVSISNPLAVSIKPGPLSTLSSRALWLNRSMDIRAGDQASAEVLFVDAYNNSVASYINFTLYFLQNGQTFDDVSVLTKRQTGYQLINFIISVIGDYSLHLVYGSNTDLKGSPLKFNIIPAPISPANCQGFWIDDENLFQLGDNVTLRLALMDAFKNSISSSSNDVRFLRFNAYVKNKVTAKNSSIKLSASSDIEDIYHTVTFYPNMSGDFLLYLFINGTEISGSPFSFTYISGALNIPKCTGSWLNGVNIFRIGQQAIFKVALRDDVGRPLIYRSYWNLLVYVMDFRGKRRMRPTLMDLGQSGYIGVSFNTTLIGNFWLRIGDDSSQIKNSPFLFSVLPGLAWSYFHVGWNATLFSTSNRYMGTP